MKNILILLTVLLLPLTADGQDKPSFSAREMADVRVAERLRAVPHATLSIEAKNSGKK